MITLRRLARGWIAGVVVALALPLQAAEVDKYLPDDTEVVMVVNARQLLDAPFVKKHALEQLRAVVKGAEAAKILDSLGFDPFKDLATITGAASTLGGQAKMVMIAHGQFD